MASLGRDECGAALIEYTLLISIAIALITLGVGTYGVWASGMWANLLTSLTP